MIEGIRPEWLPQYWPIVSPWIDAACRATGAMITADEIRASIETRTRQMWVVWANKDRPNLVIVTEIYNTAAGLTCSLTTVAGEMLEESWQALDTIEQWAREQGCVRITGEGRLGWMRPMKKRGWNAASVQMEKPLWAPAKL